jgi:hypothetical protein
MDQASRHGREEITLNLASEVLRTSGGLRFAALGGSMVPTIFPKDILIVRRETARSARTGDVVLFFRDSRFCAHRLVEKREECEGLTLITRGDALAQNDAPVAEDEFLGCVEAVVRGRKRIELDGSPSRTELLLRWAVRRSSSAVKWLLRWHRLRARLLGRDSGGAFAKAQSKFVECS